MPWKSIATVIGRRPINPSVAPRGSKPAFTADQHRARPEGPAIAGFSRGLETTATRSPSPSSSQTKQHPGRLAADRMQAQLTRRRVLRAVLTARAPYESQIRHGPD